MEHVAHQLNLCRVVSRFRPSRRTPGTCRPCVMCTLLWGSWSTTLIDDFISQLINSSSGGSLISTARRPSWVCCAPLRGGTLALCSYYQQTAPQGEGPGFNHLMSCFTFMPFGFQITQCWHLWAFLCSFDFDVSLKLVDCPPGRGYWCSEWGRLNISKFHFQTWWKMEGSSTCFYWGSWGGTPVDTLLED